MKIEHERGYLILAQNTSSTDYVACARLLAKSLHRLDADNKVCLLTDQTPDDIRDFDIVRTFPYGDLSGSSEWKLHNDWQCFLPVLSDKPSRLKPIFLSHRIFLTGLIYVNASTSY
jgi:hypothetical protein